MIHTVRAIIRYFHTKNQELLSWSIYIVVFFTVSRSLSVDNSDFAGAIRKQEPSACFLDGIAQHARVRSLQVPLPPSRHWRIRCMRPHRHESVTLGGEAAQCVGCCHSRYDARDLKLQK